MPKKILFKTSDGEEFWEGKHMSDWGQNYLLVDPLTGKVLNRIVLDIRMDKEERLFYSTEEVILIPDYGEADIGDVIKFDGPPPVFRAWEFDELVEEKARNEGGNVWYSLDEYVKDRREQIKEVLKQPIAIRAVIKQKKEGGRETREEEVSEEQEKIGIKGEEGESK